MEIAITRAESMRADDRSVEIVERKGLGHPDTICDALAEELSLELSRFYLKHTGAILHHNVDKALLVGGASQPKFGGGRVVEPMRLFLAGRATLDFAGLRAPVEEMAEQACRRWLAHHLHALDATQHVDVTALVRPGSTELTELFDRQKDRRCSLANDTSCGVGFAPLSETERLVLAVESRLNSEQVRRSDPMLGEDVKVMAVRRDREIHLTIACAMIDRALRDITDYEKATERVRELALEVAGEMGQGHVTVDVNAADDPGAGSIYLTVTGTSAESGDDGQAGRGNRVNGLITPGRAMTIESVAGKNPVTHIGKLYNLTAGLTAERIVAELPEVSSAECRLVSSIGSPIDEPQIVDVQLFGADPRADRGLREAVETIVRDELERLPHLAEEMIRGELKIDRWPLRA
jgi:S-adenosylmethionine synthetase